MPMIVVGVHTSLVALMAITVSLLGAEAPMLWVFFMILGFPASMLAGPIESAVGPLIGPVDHTARFGWFYGVTLAVLGGLQYFIISWLLRRKLRISNHR